jgi:hypothetical protein
MQSYDERLTVPHSWWLIAVSAGIAFGLIAFPFGALPFLGAFVAGTALSTTVVSAYGSARIRVVAGSLVAGDAKIPLEALGETVVLDRDEAIAWRSYKADTRAFMLLRSYVPTALKVEVTDPEDPTPYLYLSTRTPERLAAALQGVKA